MTTSITPTQQKKHDQVADQVAEFLKSGGTIQQLPYGPDYFIESDGLTAHERQHREKARKKGSQNQNWRKSGEATFNNRCAKINAERNKKKFSRKEVAA